MILTLKARIVGVVLLLFVANASFAQWSDGPFMSIGGQLGMPINKAYKPYTWAGGGFGKFSLPLGQQDYFTFSLNAISLNGKRKDGKEGNLKERDVLSGLVGYRYDFRTEDAYSYFFMEPQIGWSFVGTDYNSFCVYPSAGYSLNGKVDFGLYYMATTSTMRQAKIGVAGLLITYNFHFARSGD
jgi:hypothetical protein